MGFTLAEVLITLGIIGIVAALTIPQLISGYKKRVVETKLQKVHSILSQAVRLSEAENDVVVNWDLPASYVDYQERKKYFNRYFKPYMQIVGEKDMAFQFKKPDGTIANNEWKTYYELSDGTFVSFYTSYDVHRHLYYICFNVILSGINKDRLIIGKDEFVFYIKPSIDNSSGYVSPTLNGELTCKDAFANIDTYIQKCKSAIDGMSYCTALIYCNGWKIPDYYPVRF